MPALIVAGLRRRISRSAIVAFGLVMSVTAVALGRVRENYYLDHRYVTASRPPLGGGFRASPQWQPLQDWGRKQSHQRIGVVGRASAFGQYFFYGTDLSNHVQYIGQRDQPRHLPADRQVRGSGGRRINAGALRLHRHHAASSGADETVAPPESLWTERDKNVKAVIQSGPAAVYKVRGPA